MDYAIHVRSVPTHAVLVGFNPVHLARSARIALWDSRKRHDSHTFRSVASRLQYSIACGGCHAIVNPVVGPEPLCASSRMKGGSATKIILDAICSRAVQQMYNCSTNAEAGRTIDDCLQSFKDAYFAC